MACLNWLGLTTGNSQLLIRFFNPPLLLLKHLFHSTLHLSVLDKGHLPAEAVDNSEVVEEVVTDHASS